MITQAIYVLCGIAVLIASVGITRFGERKNIIYARLHIAGVFDVACMTAMLAAGQPLVAIAYFILTPLVVHSVANARHHRREND